MTTSGNLHSSYKALVTAFRTSLHDLRTLSMLRLEGSAISSFNQDLQVLQEDVKALEARVKEIRRHLEKENVAAAQMKKAMGKCDLQALHIDHLNRHIQQHPPQQPLPAIALERSNECVQATSSLCADSKACDDGVLSSMELSSSAACVKKKRQQAPCRLISEAEYASLSAYMTQRIPLSKVNAALEDAADLAEANKRMLVQAKTGAKMPTQEWKRAQTLLINIANREAVRGKFWLTDTDLKKSSILKADKTGKAIMTILRHVNRVAEVRLIVDGKAESVYILLPAEAV